MKVEADKLLNGSEYNIYSMMCARESEMPSVDSLKIDKLSVADWHYERGRSYELEGNMEKAREQYELIPEDRYENNGLQTFR